MSVLLSVVSGLRPGRRKSAAPREIHAVLPAPFLRCRTLLIRQTHRAAPFVVRRQPVLHPIGQLPIGVFFRRQPFAERVRIVPTHTRYRMPGALRKLWLRPLHALLFYKHLVVLHPRLPDAEEHPLPSARAAGDWHGNESHTQGVLEWSLNRRLGTPR